EPRRELLGLAELDREAPRLALDVLAVAERFETGLRRRHRTRIERGREVERAILGGQVLADRLEHFAGPRERGSAWSQPGEQQQVRAVREEGARVIRVARAAGRDALA